MGIDLIRTTRQEIETMNWAVNTRQIDTRTGRHTTMPSVVEIGFEDYEAAKNRADELTKRNHDPYSSYQQLYKPCTDDTPDHLIPSAMRPEFRR